MSNVIFYFNICHFYKHIKLGDTMLKLYNIEKLLISIFRVKKHALATAVKNGGCLPLVKSGVVICALTRKSSKNIWKKRRISPY